MNNHLKAALYTGAFFSAIAIFVWLCIVTDGAAAAVLCIACGVGIVYALIYGIVSGKIDDW